MREERLKEDTRTPSQKRNDAAEERRRRGWRRRRPRRRRRQGQRGARGGPAGGQLRAGKGVVERARERERERRGERGGRGKRIIDRPTAALFSLPTRSTPHPSPPPLKKKLSPALSQTFRPVTLERPKALLPLANAPLIDYALEWLSGSQVVDEIVVFACAHARAIEAHLVSAGWMQPSAPCSAAAPASSSASPLQGGAGGGGGGAAGPPPRGPRVSVVVSTAAASVGDALRALEQGDRLTSDFVLVSADVVANVDLLEAVRAHRERRARDRSAIATLLVRGGVTSAQRERLGEAGVCYAVDPSSMRLLAVAEDERQQQQSGRRPGGQASLGPSPAKGQQGGAGGTAGSKGSRNPIPLDTRLFGERDAVALRRDLSPAHAAILSPEAAMLFSDNFDYQSFDADFVAGTLAEEELGNKIFLHVAEGPSASSGSASCPSSSLASSSSQAPSLPSSSAYLASVANLRAFDAVGRDVAARWSWPSAASPDGNGAPLYPPAPATATARGGGASEAGGSTPAAASLWGGRPSYRGGRSLLYRESGVRAARSAALGPDAVLGAGARVGDGAVVAGGAVVGRNSAVGTRAAVVGSVLGSGCVVGDGAVVLNSLLCDGVVVLPGARVERGCVLSFGVVVGAGSVVPAFSRVSLMRPKEAKKGGDGADDAQRYSSDEAPDGFGRPGLATTSDDDDEEESDDDDDDDDEDDLGSSSDDEGEEETSSSCSEANEDEAIVGSSASSMMRRRRAAQEKKGAKAAPAAPGAKKRRGRGKKSKASSAAPSVGPPRAVAAAAAAAAAGMGPPPAELAFDTSIVGHGGAGYLWPSWSNPNALSLPPPTAEELLRGRGITAASAGTTDDNSDDSSDDDAFYGRNAAPLGRGGGFAAFSPTAAASAQQQGQQQQQSAAAAASSAKAAAEAAEADDPDFHFRREVAETFLRCALLDYEEDLAVIELNSLKIAEDKQFADVARALAVTAIALAAPPPVPSSPSESSGSGGGSRPEFAPLYAPGPAPDVSTPAGRRELLARARLLLGRWGPLLRRFLRDGDDQVELLLTLEEFCGEEGCFASTISAHGALFAAVFKELLHLLYEADVVDEDALLAWADEKAEADASERRFLERAMPLIEWLREASSEEEGEEEEGDDGE